MKRTGKVAGPETTPMGAGVGDERNGTNGNDAEGQEQGRRTNPGIYVPVRAEVHGLPEEHADG